MVYGVKASIFNGWWPKVNVHSKPSIDSLKRNSWVHPLDSPTNSVWVFDIWYLLKKETKLNIQIRLYF